MTFMLIIDNYICIEEHIHKHTREHKPTKERNESLEYFFLLLSFLFTTISPLIKK